MTRRATDPRIVAVSAPCDVIAVLDPNGSPKPFLARFIPIHSSAPLIGCVEPAIGPNRSRVNSPVSA